MTLPVGRRGRLVALGLLVLPLILLGDLALRPAVGLYLGISDDIADLQRDIARYRGVLSDLPALRTAVARLERSQPLAPFLFSGANASLAAAGVQRQLRSIADKHDATLVSVRVQPAVDEGELERIRVQARLQTSSLGLRDTLHALEASRPLLFVDKVSITARERQGASGSGLIDVQLEVSGLRAVTREAASSG